MIKIFKFIKIFNKFVFGEKVQNYFRIDKEKLGANFDLYIDASLSIDQSWFVTSSSKRSRYQDKTGKEKSSSIYGNILYAFKNFYKHDKLFIDIDSDSNFEDDGLHNLPHQVHFLIGL